MLFLALAGATAPATLPDNVLKPGARRWLHAHNCYPEGGAWRDRLDRALAAGVPTAIEQDLVWVADSATGTGRSVVSHGPPLSGDEPTLEQHFFERLRPQMEQALANDRRSEWPLVVLHLDFKTNEPAHHAAVWALLGKYEPWLTTAKRVADETHIAPFNLGPLLVLTENGAGQRETFHDRVPVGATLRLFGTTPGVTFEGTPEARATAAASASPGRLLPTAATNYQRWANFAWAVIERGGPPNAGPWTAADAARLRAIVTRAHAQGLWIRFYTLNGHEPGRGSGWSDGYNFGSLGAARERWRAAVDAGVDFIASDQYGDLAEMLR